LIHIKQPALGLAAASPSLLLIDIKAKPGRRFKLKLNSEDRNPRAALARSI